MRQLPAAFVDRLSRIFGEALPDFLREIEAPMRKSLRANTLLLPQEEFAAWAEEEGFLLTGIPWSSAGYHIDREDRTTPLGKHLLTQLGALYIQEASSQLPAELLDVQEGDTVLDMAASPGSKTTQLAALMRNTGCIVANEPDGKRSKALVFNLEKYGVHNAVLLSLDGREIGYRAPEVFDRILLDAPCTGEGTFRKEVGALDHFDARSAEKMSRLQKELLISAFLALKPGGRLVYSTCTFAPEENESVVQYLIDTFPYAVSVLPSYRASGLVSYGDMQYHPDIRQCTRLAPHTDGTEGFFACVLTKTASIPEKTGTHQRGAVRRTRFATDTRFVPLSAAEHKLFVQYCTAHFGATPTLPADARLIRKDKTVYLVPSAAEQLATVLPLTRWGVPLYKVGGDKKPTHLESACAPLLRFATKAYIELSAEQAKDAFAGSPLPAVAADADGQMLLTHRGIPLGFALASRGTLKSQLVKERRM